MDRIINTELLLNPMNWVVVILMLAIFVFGLHVLAQPLAGIGGLVNVI